MSDSDVVKHDLKTAPNTPAIDWEDFSEPVPLPDDDAEPPFEDLPMAIKPPVVTRVTDEELVSAPYRSVGQMGAIMGGKKIVGSGWVGARRAFFTAGHCVYHPKFGGWVTWAAIAPRYNNNVVPTYTVASVYALKGWLDSSKREFDMAACVVTVSFATTEPPLAFDAGILPGLNFTAIGYPAKPVPGYDFNGKRMWKCVGDFIRTKKNRLYAANNFTSGGSGGPWCETGRLGVVSGLNAARHTDPQIAISPYFASGFQKLYDAVKDF